MRYIQRAWVSTALLAAIVGPHAAYPQAAGAASFPRPGWAHLDGRVNLLPLGAAPTTDDVAAKLAIEETFARWGIAYDESQLDVIRSLFTRDALFEVAKGSGKPFVQARGIDAIGKSVASALSQQKDQRRHAISNVVFERLTPTDASTIAYGVVTVAADGLTLGASVIYTADLHREADGQWRFAHLFVGMDDYSGVAPHVETSRH